MTTISMRPRTMHILLMFISMFVLTVAAQGQPVAKFSANILSGCSPILVNFTDQSSGHPTEWKWDLGNGTFSNLQNPSVTYFNPGFYTVKLVVRTSNKSDSAVKVNYINVFQSSIVNFSADATNGCTPFAVNFTDHTITGSGINLWQWDFGDGVLSAQQNPAHTYTLPGNYNVTLKVTSANGCVSTLRKSGYIQNNSMHASFTSKAVNICVPNKIDFQNGSTGTGTTVFNWDFGDGDTSHFENPVHSFTTDGTYNVKLTVKNQYGCIDSFIKTHVITKAVSAFFSGDKLLNCKPPVTVNFTNQNLTDNNYSWDFGDSTTSTSSNPSHEYRDTGIYTVKLAVRNTNGCADSTIKTAMIRIKKPFVGLVNLPDSGCLQFTRQFSVNNNSSSSVISYLWNFGDGSTSAQRTPTHTFTNAGYYNISVAATDSTGCTDTAFMQNAIKISTKPAANFSADIKNTCASTSISFTDLTSGQATSRSWAFDHNAFSVDRNPTYIYKDTGWMNVSLIAMNGGCSDTVSFENYIYIKPAVANFNFNFKCSDPLKRIFNNLSIGATRWLWDFGDGTTSTDFSPVHNFPGSGSYFVTLTAWNDSTGCSYVKTKRIKVLDFFTDFYASDTSTCKRTRMNFSTGSVNLDIMKYTWHFGDDTVVSSKVNIASHAYQNAGNYSVKLITVDSLNCVDTVFKPMYIKVHGPKAAAAVLNNGGCPGLAVQFLDRSVAEAANPIRSWIWDFGDGITDTLTFAPFFHSYQTQGSYTVSVKLIDSLNCSDVFKLPLPVVIKKPSARFSAYDSAACPNFPVRLVCPYVEAGITYKWDFGDGGTATTQYVAHSYSAEGIYTIKLIIRNKYGCEDTSIATNLIRVKKAVALFDMSDSFRTCPPLLIQFTSHSTNALSEYWNFGDSSSTNANNPSHFYTYPGVYTASLIARGPGACADTTKRKIIVNGPKGNISYVPLRLCKPYEVNFMAHTEDAVSYIWDFNDGVTLICTDTVVKYTYRDSGSFVPKIILVDDAGCRVPVTGKDTLTNVFAKLSFKFPDSLLCNGGNVSFTNNTISNDQIAVYHWKFGDSSISDQISPVHQYNTPGIYFPSLSVTTNTGCTESYRSSVPIKVAISPDISMLLSDNGCTPLTVTMIGILSSHDTSAITWYWDMGNHNSSILKDPPAQTFSEPGIHTISLTANSSNGCSTTKQKTVESFSLPAVKITGNNILCRGKEAILTAGGAAKYKWLADASLNCDTIATVIAKPVSSTKYLVTGRSIQGCIDTDSFYLNVHQPFVMTYSRPVTICSGESSRMEANGAHTYQWYPAEGLSSATAPNPLAQPRTTTNYRVIGADDNGCFRDTGYIKFTVNSLPTVDAGEDKTISLGLPLDLKANYSGDVIDVRWAPTTEIFRNSDNSITVKPIHNTDYTVEVKNRDGCRASDRVGVTVTFGNDNVFIPNVFSPNGDGVNEIFYPRGRGIFKVKKMIIFSRWGETIFEKTNFNSNDPAAGWDGTYRGRSLGADVFIYQVELVGDNGTVLPVKGNISLIK